MLHKYIKSKCMHVKGCVEYFYAIHAMHDVVTGIGLNHNYFLFLMYPCRLIKAKV